jgi:phospholipase A1
MRLPFASFVTAITSITSALFSMLAAALLVCSVSANAATPLPSVHAALAATNAIGQVAPIGLAASIQQGTACLQAVTDQETLACFKAWAAQQVAPQATATSVQPDIATPTQVDTQLQAASTQLAASTHCKAAVASPLQRFWELTPETDCDTFGLRGYKPLSLMWSTATGVNKQPDSPQVGHTATTSLNYQGYETLIQLSVRTKVAKGLLVSDGERKDALWFGYTQKSFWQLFNADLSRPFRATDHEPEVMYIFPTNHDLGNGWNWRYAGLSLNHQSNGQTLPLSRSWNRAIAMTGLDHADGSRIEAKLWRRMREDAANDDNPDIANFMGRGEVKGLWAISPKTSLGLTLRHALTAGGKGAVQIDWLKQPSNSAQALGLASGMRYHVQVFSGYGDSLTDYNHKRTALRVGVSLVDW